MIVMNGAGDQGFSPKLKQVYHNKNAVA